MFDLRNTQRHNELEITHSTHTNHTQRPHATRSHTNRTNTISVVSQRRYRDGHTGLPLSHTRTHTHALTHTCARFRPGEDCIRTLTQSPQDVNPTRQTLAEVKGRG